MFYVRHTHKAPAAHMIQQLIELCRIDIINSWHCLMDKVNYDATQCVLTKKSIDQNVVQGFSFVLGDFKLFKNEPLDFMYDFVEHSYPLQINNGEKKEQDIL